MTDDRWTPELVATVLAVAEWKSRPWWERVALRPRRGKILADSFRQITDRQDRP